MTNKYSGLSDFEVNRKIDELFYDIFSLKYPFNNDWCNDNNKAFKLVIANGMQLSPSMESKTWSATKVLNYKMSAFLATNKNPCRAIAECFLLMKDAENKDDQEA